MRRIPFTLVVLLTLVTTALAFPASYTLLVLDPGVIPIAIDRVQHRALVQVEVQQPTPHTALILLTEDGVQTILTLPDEVTTAFGQGTAGQLVAGQFHLGPFGSRTHAFGLSEDGTFQNLGTTDGDILFSAASGVNTQGLFAGFGDNPDASQIVALRSDGSGWQILPLLASGPSFGMGINEAGSVVGFDATPTGAAHAVVWPLSGGETDVHPVTTPSRGSLGLAINTAGSVAGQVLLLSGDRGFVRTEGGTVTLCEPATGEQFTSLGALNDADEAVGYSGRFARDENVRQAIRCEQGQAVPLLPLTTGADGWTFQRALGISNDGAILVVGTYQGQARGALLRPVTPAPAPEKPKEPEPRERRRPGQRR